MTPDDELDNEQVIEYMKYLLIKIKRHLEKKPILNSSNYSFTDKLEKEESLQEAIDMNQQLKKEIKLQNAEFEKIL